MTGINGIEVYLFLVECVFAAYLWHEREAAR